MKGPRLKMVRWDNHEEKGESGRQKGEEASAVWEATASTVASQQETPTRLLHSQAVPAKCQQSFHSDDCPVISVSADSRGDGGGHTMQDKYMKKIKEEQRAGGLTGPSVSKRERLDQHLGQIDEFKVILPAVWFHIWFYQPSVFQHTSIHLSIMLSVYTPPHPPLPGAPP